MNTNRPALCYKRHRFPKQIISHAVWLYYRFTLSYRDVEEMLHRRGITVTYEAIRLWGARSSDKSSPKGTVKLTFGGRLPRCLVACWDPRKPEAQCSGCYRAALVTPVRASQQANRWRRNSR